MITFSLIICKLVILVGMAFSPSDPSPTDYSLGNQPTFRSRKVIQWILIIAAMIAVGIAFYYRTTLMSGYWMAVSRLFGGAVLAAILIGFALSRIPKSKLRSAFEGIAVSVFTLIFLLLILEAYFKLFVAETDTNGELLASQNWFERYWKPINSLGYRDLEWTPESLEGKTRIMVLGDSFAAGHGIRDISQRFSGVLATDLGESYAVMTVAELGWSTQQEADALADYPYPPDWVILSYYINDNEILAGKYPTQSPQILNQTYAAPRLVRKSYLLNYVYYRALRLPIFETGNASSYVQFLEELYTNPEAWAAYTTEFQQIIDWCDQHHARLMVVIFPSLVDPSSTDFATDRVAGFFQEKHIPILEVETLIDGWRPADRVINRFDPHPSEKLDAAVGHALAERLRELEADSSKTTP